MDPLVRQKLGAPEQHPRLEAAMEVALLAPRILQMSEAN